MLGIPSGQDLTQIQNALQEIYQAINGLQQTVSKIFPLGVTSSATYNPPSIASGSQATTTVTCPGATLGMSAQGSFSLDLAGLLLTAYVSSAGVVTCIFANLTGAPVDLASGTLTVWARLN